MSIVLYKIWILLIAIFVVIAGFIVCDDIFEILIYIVVYFAILSMRIIYDKIEELENG